MTYNYTVNRLLKPRRYFMIKVSLKDGSVREFEKGTTILEAAKAIHKGLEKEAVAG
jgi:hypothetical protein